MKPISRLLLMSALSLILCFFSAGSKADTEPAVWSADEAWSGTGPLPNDLLKPLDKPFYLLTYKSPDTDCHQGYTTDGTNHYCFDTAVIYKFDSSWKPLATNSNPFPGLAVKHLGAGKYYDGKLYQIAEVWNGECGNYSNQTIVVYDATTLALVDSHDIAMNDHEVSAITVVPEQNALYISSFCQGYGLWKYRMSDFALVGFIRFSTTITRIQGIDYADGRFYVATDYPGNVYSVNFDGEVTKLFTVYPDFVGTYFYGEGIDASQGQLRILLDGGKGNKRIHFFTKQVAPTITEHPQDLLILQGGTAQFHATVTGSDPITFRWQKDAADLADTRGVSGATSAALTITGICPADAGNYRLVVSNAAGSVTSSVARLELDLPPTIAVEPASQVIALNGDARFEVQATGTGQLHYQWFRNGRPIENGTGPSFKIPTCSTESAGTYQVQIWNNAGTNWSASANLLMNTAKMYAGINVYGDVGKTFIVQYTTNLTAPVWTVLQSATIVTNPTVVIDYDSGADSQRFYRTIPQ